MSDPLARPFAAVLFDMDGTLISSIAAVERSWLQLAEEFGFEMIDFDELHGVPSRDSVDRMLADRSVEERERATQRILDLELNDVDGAVVLPGTRDAVATLRGRCAVVTSATRDLAAVRLGSTGLAELPLVTADDVPRGKPAPDPYLAGAALLGVPPADCLVVEDAGAGLASGRAAGMTTLALTTTHAPGSLTADLEVADLSAVRFTVGADGVRLSLVEITR